MRSRSFDASKIIHTAFWFFRSTVSFPPFRTENTSTRYRISRETIASESNLSRVAITTEETIYEEKKTVRTYHRLKDRVVSSWIPISWREVTSRVRRARRTFAMDNRIGRMNEKNTQRFVPVRTQLASSGYRRRYPLRNERSRIHRSALIALPGREFSNGSALSRSRRSRNRREVPCGR